MRYAIASLLAAIALLGPVPASAQVNDGQKLSEKSASRVFWSFSKCAVRRKSDQAEQLVVRFTDDQAGRKLVDEFAQKHRKCLIPGEELRMRERLFVNALASAAFVAKYRDLPLPDFASAPPIVTDEDLAEAANPNETQSLVLLAFGECVFKNKSSEVRALLEERPFTDGESAKLSVIMPTLGACLPAQEGNQIKFSRIGLRGILGRAAYAVDREYASKTVSREHEDAS